MKTCLSLTTTALAALALASCGEQTPADAPRTDAMMNEMPMGEGMMEEGVMSSDIPAAKTARGVGVVTAIDKEKGAITLDHQPMPEANWPAMTMAFKATSPRMLDQVKVGDRVAFELKLEDGAGEITAIEMQ